MAKARSTRTKTAIKAATKTSASRRRNLQPKWVRKNVVIDQRKLDLVRRAYGAATDKEAIDQALDNMVFSYEFTQGIEAMRRIGGVDTIEEVFKRR